MTHYKTLHQIEKNESKLQSKLGIGYFEKRQIIILTRTTKTYATQRVYVPPFGTLVPLICTWFPSFSSALFMMCSYFRYFFQLQNARTPRSALSFALCPCLFQRLRWVSLWTHSSTVTRSTSRLSTGERWECAEVNTVCSCWQYWYTGKACRIQALPKQLAHCGERCERVDVNILCCFGWMQSELLFLTLCTHDHCVRDCCMKFMAERGRLICHVQSWELIVPQLTAFWFEKYLELFIFSE